MRDYDAAMLLYAQLARESRSRRQMPPRDRFLLLTGMESLRAGLPAVAERCRELILKHNPRHMLGQFETFALAAADADFQRLVSRTGEEYRFEVAEAVLETLPVPPPPAELGVADQALWLLRRAE